ncbi:SURF1 family protein [Brachybacterium sp. UNK5269]|uniref:SURF1 family protein n=1 Tax=Brachybacterium sp. UNK5269 TaxID=3408576 RepID=UPI003BAFB56E
MLRVALRPQFLGLLALMVAATLVCGLLAGWQWDRAHRALSDKAAGSQLLGDIRDVVEVGGAVTNAIAGDTVTASGRYLPGEQVLVPGRHIDGTDAVVVVSALEIALEDGTRARLPVARGWLPAADVLGADGEIDAALAPTPPAGEVEISGRLEASEAASGGVSDGVASEIATPLLVNEWGSPMYAGFVAVDQPTAPLRPLPPAESRFSQGLDWQNIGYSFQWVLFAVFFLYLWWRSVRTTHLDEVADRREAMQRALGGAEDGAAPGPAAAPATPAAAVGAAPATPAAAVGAAPATPAAAVGAAPSSAAPRTTAPTPDKDV